MTQKLLELIHATQYHHDQYAKADTLETIAQQGHAFPLSVGEFMGHYIGQQTADGAPFNLDVIEDVLAEGHHVYPASFIVHDSTLYGSRIYDTLKTARPDTHPRTHAMAGVISILREDYAHAPQFAETVGDTALVQNGLLDYLLTQNIHTADQEKWITDALARTNLNTPSPDVTHKDAVPFMVRCSTSTAQHLLSFRPTANVNVQDADGNTRLMYLTKRAIQSRILEVPKNDIGVDISIADNTGNTVQDVLMERREQLRQHHAAMRSGQFNFNVTVVHDDVNGPQLHKQVTVTLNPASEVEPLQNPNALDFPNDVLPRVVLHNNESNPFNVADTAYLRHISYYQHIFDTACNSLEYQRSLLDNAIQTLKNPTPNAPEHTLA